MAQFLTGWAKLGLYEGKRECANDLNISLTS